MSVTLRSGVKIREVSHTYLRVPHPPFNVCGKNNINEMAVSGKNLKNALLQ